MGDLKPHHAGVFSRTHPRGEREGGGGGLSTSLTSAVAVARRPSKALNEFFSRKLKNGTNATSQANVRSKVKIVTFRLISYQDGTNNRSNLNFGKRFLKE